MRDGLRSVQWEPVSCAQSHREGCCTLAVKESLNLQSHSANTSLSFKQNPGAILPPACISLAAAEQIFVESSGLGSSS